mmetsp:Transcript_835/g.2864  ORF Transcript_835/g.2864 Transcript_835/m.2864 type:complete len:166 (-) Transcript_835:198-695(-)|eukprot:CAMPEP_0117446446 /NCGR_PEP_ID=MMETSP0759-20121206/6345_1 /TAXON_ID=63605 /ORGANISM="Percolomonas cosmopolitus, Strain WS" /LENGTH=165 /DNA_ID=CAMNT_0005238713 /DNA_START=334 /DNA_END=831 /DNA_ORIENTATION=+
MSESESAPPNTTAQQKSKQVRKKYLYKDKDGNPLPDLEGKIPPLYEEALKLRLTRYAQNRCGPFYKEFATCTKDKMLGIVYKCKKEFADLSECMNAFASRRNMNILRYAYLEGKLVRARTYVEYKQELNRRLKDKGYDVPEDAGVQDLLERRNAAQQQREQSQSV